MHWRHRRSEKNKLPTRAGLVVALGFDRPQGLRVAVVFATIALDASAVLLQAFALITLDVVLQPAGVALEVLEAACAAAACAVSGTRLGARRVDKVQRLEVRFVGVSTGKSARRVAFGGQFDHIAEIVLGGDVVEGTHESHGVGVLAGVASQVRLDFERSVALGTHMSGFLAVVEQLVLHLDFLGFELWRIGDSALPHLRNRSHGWQLNVARSKVGGHRTVLHEELVHEQSQQLAAAGGWGVGVWRSSKVLEGLRRLVEANHVERKVRLWRLNLLLVAQHGGLVGRRKGWSQGEIRHGEVEPPRCRLLKLHREVELWLFGRSEVVVEEFDLVISQGELEVVSGTQVGSSTSGVADPVDLGAQERWKEALAEKVFLEEGSEGKGKWRAVA